MKEIRRKSERKEGKWVEGRGRAPAQGEKRKPWLLFRCVK